MLKSSELLARLSTPEARAERAANWERRAEIDRQIEAELVAAAAASVQWDYSRSTWANEAARFGAQDEARRAAAQAKR